MDLKSLDKGIIRFFQKISVPSARIGLFVVFFWFGLLKVINLSPATGLVQNLFEQTVSFISFGNFLIFFGLFEMLIGIFFIIKGMERVVILLLFIQITTTFGPLALLPETTWSGFMVPTLEGQYIIKNLVIIAVAIGIAAHLHPARSWREMV